MNLNGVIIFNKPTGCSSHKCVSIARRILKIKKIGHTGTLDPEASGVLPLLIGQATKAAEYLTAEDKEYRATVLLGTKTDTLDCEGEIIEVNPVNITSDEVRDVISSFVGDIEQIPPMYSAVSVNGQRLYKLARQGIEVERQPRKITIFSINIVSVKLPELVIDVHCSKGTYIRTLAADIGDALGCGGCIKALQRTKCGIFGIENAVTAEQLESLSESGRAEDIIIPIDRLFSGYPEIHLDKKRSDRVKNGVPIFYPEAGEEGTVYRIYDEKGVFTALSESDNENGKKCLRLVKGFYQ